MAAAGTQIPPGKRLSSGGKLIVFTGRRDSDEYRRFVFVNADRQVVGTSRVAASGKHSVSPDGQWIAFTYEASVCRTTGVQKRT